MLRHRSITKRYSLIKNLQNLLRLIDTPVIERAVAGHTGRTFVLVQVLVLAMSFSIQVHQILESERVRTHPTKRSRRR